MRTDSDGFRELTRREPRRKLSDQDRMVNAITEALAKAQPAPAVPGETPVVNVTVPVPKVVVEHKGEGFPDRLVFDVIRDGEGRMTQVVMRRP